MPILSFDKFKNKSDVKLGFSQEEFDFIKTNIKRSVVDVYSATAATHWNPFKSKDVDYANLEHGKAVIHTIRVRFSLYYDVRNFARDKRYKDELKVDKIRKYLDNKFVVVYNIEGDSTNYLTFDDLINAVKLHILTWRISVYLFNTTFRTNVKKTLELLNDYSVIRDNKVSEFRFKDMCDELGQLDSSDYIIKQLKDYEVEFVK
jgi:hypothetical protein